MNLLLRVSNYISRYAPSEKKLTEYISKKKPTFPISAFLDEIGYSEILMIDMWIRTFLVRGSGIREIQMKLYKKWFPKDLIEEKLAHSISELQDWKQYEEKISRTIDDLLRKWKSLQIIQITLIGKYPYFRDEIRELLAIVSDDSWLQKEIEKYRLKYNLNNAQEKQKFFLAIQRKWFRYQQIRNALIDSD